MPTDAADGGEHFIYSAQIFLRHKLWVLKADVTINSVGKVMYLMSYLECQDNDVYDNRIS